MSNFCEFFEDLLIFPVGAGATMEEHVLAQCPEFSVLHSKEKLVANMVPAAFVLVVLAPSLHPQFAKKNEGMTVARSFCPPGPATV